MVKMKKLLLLILIPILLLTSKNIYAYENVSNFDSTVILETNYILGVERVYFEESEWDLMTAVKELSEELSYQKMMYIAPLNRLSFINVNINDDYSYDIQNVFLITVSTDDYYPNATWVIRYYGINNNLLRTAYTVSNSYNFSYSVDIYSPKQVSNESEYRRGFNDGYDEAKEAYAYYDNGDYFTGYFAYNLGYNKGINEQDATGFLGLLAGVFGGLASLLAIEILPNIPLGAIIAVPLVFGVIAFILGKRKGD